MIKHANKTLPRALASLNLQSDSDFNVLIKDYERDQSTERLIYATLTNLQPCNIRYVAQRDCGIYDALNQAIDLIDDGYIAILHSDDSYPVDAISRMKDTINQNPSDIIYGFNRHVNQHQEEHCIVRFNHRLLPLRNMTTIEHTSSIIHRNCFRQVGLYSTKYMIASDYEFFLRSFLYGSTFHPCDSILCNHTQGGLSQSRMHLARSEMLAVKYQYKIIPLLQYLLLSFISKSESLIRQVFLAASST